MEAGYAVYIRSLLQFTLLLRDNVLLHLHVSPLLSCLRPRNREWLQHTPWNHLCLMSIVFHLNLYSFLFATHDIWKKKLIQVSLIFFFSLPSMSFFVFFLSPFLCNERPSLEEADVIQSQIIAQDFIGKRGSAVNVSQKKEGKKRFRWKYTGVFKGEISINLSLGSWA